MLTRCPDCGELPTIGIDAKTDEYSVACMNACCSNMQRFLSNNQSHAMLMWNKWASNKIRKKEHVKDSTELSGGKLW